MHYQKHIFFCTNLRTNGAKCCQDGNATEMFHYTKARLRQLDCSSIGNIRVSTAGCLGRCKLGPALVIYPEGVWYRYQSEHDIDLIIEQHILAGKVVAPLLIAEQ